MSRSALPRRVMVAGMALILVPSLDGCVSAQHLARQQAPAPVFAPAMVFAGHTLGKAMLKVVMHRPVAVTVDGHGRIDADGTLILEQSIQTGAAPARHRTWRLRPAGAGRWTGTLSDAAGPVRGDIVGNCLHLAFAMHGGLTAQQWLYLQGSGGTVRNVMVVRKLGMPVARLDEIITRQPEPAS